MVELVYSNKNVVIVDSGCTKDPSVTIHGLDVESVIKAAEGLLHD